MAKAKAGEQETADGPARTSRKTAAKSTPSADGAGGGNGRAQGHAGVLADSGTGAANGAKKGRATSVRGGGNGGTPDTASAGGSAVAKKTAGGARKPAAGAGRATGGATKTAASARSGGSRGKKPDLRADLRDFASARPSGWDHDDWLGFLDHLKSRGHDTSDHDGVGRSLERERLAVTLERVDGLDSRTVDTLTERFGTLYSLRNADADEIASAGVPRDVAEKVAGSVREG
ncbi:MAG: hypothetical protein JWM27_4445 [Gemmatimonadetes bacterium]|nr:hypothetical protein [Gemmatimonadota bacterium]